MGMRIVAYLLEGVKLLLAVPVFLAGFTFGILGTECDGFDFNRLMYLSIFLGAIGLGYPFSFFRTKGPMNWFVVAFSAMPFCFAVISFPTTDMGVWVFRGIGLSWIVLALADLLLSTRLPPLPPGVTKRRFVWTSCLALLGIAVAGTGTFVATRGRPYRPPATAFEGSSCDLRRSVVVPTLDTPIPDGRNVIWCGTMQLAWNHLAKDVLREPPRLQGAEAVASRLNQEPFGEDDLPPRSYLAMAGFAKDGVAEKIRSDMKQRFRKDVEIDAMEPNEVLAYAYLEASAAFTIPFFETREPLRFIDSKGTETQVSSFGIEQEREYAYNALRRQIDVLYVLRKDRTPEQLDEFVLDLCRDSSPNQVIVACVPRKATLRETLNDVEDKSRKAAEDSENVRRGRFGVRDVLLVPNLEWEVRHHFSELEGKDKRFVNAGFEEYHIAKAMQTIRFRLDRSGAEVASEAQVLCKPCASHFVCDRPFLIVVKKRGAERPFFVMWVDNPELLCKP